MFLKLSRVALAAAVLALLPGAHASRNGSASRVGMTSPVRPAAAGIGPGLVLPSADAGLPLVAVVAADIDADGDLDLIGGGVGLDLFVWINDGAGHLTRQQPHHSSGWRTAAPGPTLDDHGTTSLTASLGAGGAADDRHIAAQVLQTARHRVRTAGLFLASAPVRTGRPRAPPSLVLT